MTNEESSYLLEYVASRDQKNSENIPEIFVSREDRFYSALDLFKLGIFSIITTPFIEGNKESLDEMLRRAKVIGVGLQGVNLAVKPIEIRGHSELGMLSEESQRKLNAVGYLISGRLLKEKDNLGKVIDENFDLINGIYRLRNSNISQAPRQVGYSFDFSQRE